MSMKVYDAYRVKKSVDLWPFLWRLRDTAQANIRTALREHYWDLVRREDPEDPEYQEALAKYGAGSEHGFRLTRAHNKVHKLFGDNLSKSTRDTYALEVMVAIYPYKGRYYLRSFCEPTSVVGTVLDFVEHLPELEDYHYQNSTDRPDDVTAADWRQRRVVWDGITEAYHDVGSHVTLDILSWTGFIHVDPWRDMAREWHANPPTLPIREEVWADDLRALRSLRHEKITASPGLIQGESFAIWKEGTGWNFQIKKWKPRWRPTLNRAADRVWFEYQPEQTKEWVRIAQSEAKEQRRAQKSAK